MNTDSLVSRRATTLASVPSQRRINAFLRDSFYTRRQHEPGICDLALGNPHQMPQSGYVEALQDALTPRNEQWFAYKTNEPEAQAAVAASLQRLLGLPFEPADIHLTTGGFTAIPLALKAVADPGDEVIFTLPPWFFYEPLQIEAGLVPGKNRCDAETFDGTSSPGRRGRSTCSSAPRRRRRAIQRSPRQPGRLCAAGHPVRDAGLFPDLAHHI